MSQALASAARLSAGSRIVAIVSAGDATVPGLLAAEALKRAAAAKGRTAEVEIRTTDGVLSPLDPGRIEGATALAVGGPDPRLPGAETATLAEILTDAAAVVARLPDAHPRAANDPGSPTTGAAATGGRRIVAVTSCPTGIAHTFMAAEGLLAAASALGDAIRVETQGSVGAGTPLTPAEIAEADLVIVAADRVVDLSRFGGKRVFQSNTKPAINDGRALIARAFAEAAVQGGPATAAASAQAPAKAGPYRHLMTGVSFMLPFVVSGGLLIALAFALGGIYTFDESHQGTLAFALFQIGAKSAFALIVPALAGYIAFSIADRPGIAPGMIGGMLASSVGAGFIGGIVAGFIAGYGVAWMNRAIRLPKNLEGLKPVLILPVLGSLLVGLLMIYAVGTPVARLLAAMTDTLRGMQGSSAIVLGLLIGAMMAFDMGGPINKAAYAFSTGLIASNVYTPMAAAMVAGMTPPIAIAIAARLFPSRFTESEREAGDATGILGIAFITEGAIPFAARDPLRVIPALVAGSAIAGAISMAVGAELKVPHGGIFVLPIPGAVTHLLGYVAALVAGTAVSAVALGLFKTRPAPAIAAS